MEFLKRVSPKFESEKVDLAELKTSAEGITACLRLEYAGIRVKILRQNLGIHCVRGMYRILKFGCQTPAVCN